MYFYSQNGWMTEGSPSTFIRSYGGSYAESSVGTVDWRVNTTSGAGTEAGGSSSWRGDHTFSSKAAGFSLRNFIEPEIESANPHLSKQEIQRVALKKFEQRLKQDLSFEHQEASHHDSTVLWTVIEGKNGKKEFATKYGDELITLSQLWEHTKEYAQHTGNPHAYNKEEARSQIAMQDAFINGNAKGFVSILSHPDSVRYVQLWEKMPTGDIASKQIDLYATTGRDFTHKEGEAFIHRLTQYHETIGTSVKYEDIAYAHVLFTSGVVTVDEIKTIAVAHAFASEPRILPMRTDMKNGIALKVAKDIHETAAFLGENFHAYIQKKVENMNAWYVQKKKNATIEYSKAPVNILSKDAVIEALMPLKASETVKKLQMPEKLVHDVFSEWAFEQTVISYASLHEELAISALQIVLFDPSAVSVNVREENSFLHVEHGERSLMESVTKNETYDVRETVESVLGFLQKIFGDKSIASHWQVENVQTVDADGDITKVPKDNERIESGILFILQSLSYLAMGSFDVSPRIDFKEDIDMSLYIDEVNQFAPSEKRSRQEHSRVIFGVVIWMILQGFDRKTKSGEIIDQDLSTQEKKDMYALKSDEIFSTSPWVLLSIIWYLSQLKEAGMLQTLSPLPAKKQKKAASSQFPLSGTIYYYIHDRIQKDTHHSC